MSEKRLLVLASGEGTNFQAIIDAVSAGRLDARIVGLISDRRECGALKRAEKSRIEAISLPRTERNRDRYFRDLLELIRSRNPDLIVLAGFMKILPTWLVEEFPFRIVNTHPSLLPCFGGPGFYGNKVHEKVMESGARISGCTVHFVTPDVDAGPIILQEAVEVQDDDTAETLSGRIKEREHDALVRAIRIILSGNYEIDGKRVRRTQGSP